MIDMLFKIELYMNKQVGDNKTIAYAKWNKSIKELTSVKDATQLDIENDIAIWEVVVDIKAFPFEHSDQAKENHPTTSKDS